MARESIQLSFSSFRGPDTTACFRAAAGALGDDAVALRTVIHRDATPALRAEIVAAPSMMIEQFRARLTPGPLVRADRATTLREGPLVVAVVGPTGGGKSTIAARLASHETAFGSWRAGLLTLDTRPGALERLHEHAKGSGIPLEVVYEPAQASGAMRRLLRAHCDVVIVDTPGQGPRADALDQRWTASLRALAPDEVHLAVPAGCRTDLAGHLRASAELLGVTHAVITKLDELPGAHGLAELAAAISLPVRWIGEGQDPAGELRAAIPRLLSALGAPTSLPPATQATDRATPTVAPGAFSFLTRRRSIAASR